MNHFVYVRKISAHTLLILWIFEEITFTHLCKDTFDSILNWGGGGGGGGGAL